MFTGLATAAPLFAAASILATGAMTLASGLPALLRRNKEPSPLSLEINMNAALVEGAAFFADCQAAA